MSATTSPSNPNNSSSKSRREMIRRLQYEVFGKVQGVFFRKYTKQSADQLGLKGYVRNTSTGTVGGEIVGPANAVEEFKIWLCTTGSPKSKIDKCEFSKNDEQHYVVVDDDSCTFQDFQIIRNQKKIALNKSEMNQSINHSGL